MFILVGVTGGIAAYKSVHLVRLLVQQGHDVHVIPTDDSLRFIGLTTWEAISRNPVTTSVHDDVARVRHVTLGQSADLVIVAPATANTLAAMAAGLASDLLGTTLLATTAPVVVAPAMHTEMWRHPATTDNVATLRERGVLVVGPADGPLTGGDSGPGRMSEPDDIVAAALAAVSGGPLSGLRVAVSTGGTREPLDPVRFLGNRSSGRQGAELALDAARRGATVTLVAASVDAGVLDAVAAHPRATIENVETAAQLGEAMGRAAASADVVVMVAAVADYRAASVSERKLRKEDGPLESIALVPNDDILAGLAAARRPGQTVVGFAAETADDDLLERARRKRERKGVDLLVVNEVGWDTGFGAGGNTVAVIGAEGAVVAEATGSKAAVAGAVWDAIAAARGIR
ncbi:bifunctional phosphopantothenoylcysteine decarboxylase/phosphopantothenate--cysteine ligase CoaBC [Microbacterium imperiale]|uniref:Coenzyme A biosynthesis bifunctional protein CoaBC n=1 Tax=Microbacterium imperiale TaxID=33884 RepID=A0A9W6M3A4_9MICO|nr:bifunctional phosphopantothenoylcysteine decarboxylase/phosphopantothenate--cysteine ligase CoaBC [Microbacterium imperiale]MBP2421952.1 phosphopantothenoylcysteine decarboxylase/phosphopantothenate--cysteine ligase [Microbacterium imperiale]MDS0200111.1 bifunctional phosphopantothenoylcysteine decarboxylase/phosphopantothenate--cysteine ligase CoaBC [Microbacterium imperiale]BFE39259.1 bifunctional phosphopantothenoylcysteine decarboxylase/phosphopantothenate--cysteine ligase CoaBC [Microbac